MEISLSAEENRAKWRNQKLFRFRVIPEIFYTQREVAQGFTCSINALGKKQADIEVRLPGRTPGKASLPRAKPLRYGAMRVW
jgi:hypothetical protein